MNSYIRIIVLCFIVTHVNKTRVMERAIFRPDEVRKIVAAEMCLVRQCMSVYRACVMFWRCQNFRRDKASFRCTLNVRNCKLPRIVCHPSISLSCFPR